MPKYKKQDSLFVTKELWQLTLFKTTQFIFMAKGLVTGKENNRIIRAYNNVRFYKTDERKCDSLHSGSKAITKLIGNPILWNGKAKLQEI
jgi:hypothetical protein